MWQRQIRFQRWSSLFATLSSGTVCYPAAFSSPRLRYPFIQLFRYEGGLKTAFVNFARECQLTQYAALVGVRRTDPFCGTAVVCLIFILTPLTQDTCEKCT